MALNQEQLTKAAAKSSIGFTAQMLASGIPADRTAVLLKRAQDVGAHTATRQAKLTDLVLAQIPALRQGAAAAA